MNSSVFAEKAVVEHHSPTTVLAIFVICLSVVAVQAEVIFEPGVPLLPSMLSDSASDFTPVIETDGKGTWIVAWISAEYDSSLEVFRYDIVRSRSIDLGETWSEGVKLNIDPVTEIGPNFYLRIASMGGGRWIGAWTHEDQSETYNSDVYFSRSEDDGVTWSFPVLIDPNHASIRRVHNVTDISVSDQNHVIVAIMDYDPPGTLAVFNTSYYSSSDAGATWSSHQSFPFNRQGRETAMASRNGWQFAVSLTGSFSLILNTLSILSSSDHGVTWSNRMDIGEASIGYEVAADPHGRVIIAAVGSNSLQIFASDDFGASWKPPVPLSPDMTENTIHLQPDIDRDPSDMMVVAWGERDGVQAGAYTYRVLTSSSVTNGTSWTSPAPLIVDEAFEANTPSSPQVAADNHGRWLAVWSVNLKLQGAMSEVDRDIVVSMGRSTNSLRNWTKFGSQ